MCSTTNLTMTAERIGSVYFLFFVILSVFCSSVGKSVEGSGDIQLKKDILNLVSEPSKAKVTNIKTVNTDNKFIGDAEENIPCKSNPCMNGGSCYEVKDGYACNCSMMLTGKNCEIVLDRCLFMKCTKHRICRNSSCVCHDNFREENGICVQMSPCTSSPCQNGGSCSEKKGGYTCDCRDDYTGTNCEDTVLDRCILMLCPKHKVCRNSSCVCKDNFRAENGTCVLQVEEIAWCATGGMGQKMCPKGCNFDHETNTGYCTCPEGQFFDYSKESCQVLDRCPFMTCSKEHEICKNSVCVCKDNFKDVKGTCVANFCEAGKHQCGESSKCEEDLKYPGFIKCSCKDGFYFNGQNCTENDLCSLPGNKVCEQICHTSNQTCDCESGYKLNPDNRTCKLTDPKVKCTKMCGSGICLRNDTLTTCICPPTHVYRDNTCVDKCTAGEPPDGLCPENNCTADVKLGFICNCEGKYKYSQDGITCERKLMCTEDNGSSICAIKGGICKDDISASLGFTCTCQDGEDMDVDGQCRKKCELQKYKAPCEAKRATCDVLPDFSTTCKCPPALTFGKDGRCSKLADMSYTGIFPMSKDHYFRNDLQNEHMWSEQSIIEKKKISSSFKIDYEKMRMNLRESMAQLYSSNYKFVDVIHCDILESFLNCTVELQFQAEPKSQLNLIGAPTSCLTTNKNSDVCVVPPALFLQNRMKPVVFSNTDPCTEEFKNVLCGHNMGCIKAVDGSKNFVCSCAEGFASFGFYRPLDDTRTVIHKCEDIDECLVDTSCPNNTRCLNTYGSYECLCEPGYRNHNSTTHPKQHGCKKLCDPNPCNKGKCLPVQENAYACRCDSGFTGINCSEEKFDSMTIIVGSAMGIALLAVCVLFVLILRRIKKNKSADKSNSEPMNTAEMMRRHHAANGYYK